MKKAFFCATLMLLGVLVFGQNLRDYTPLTAGNIADAARLQSTRFIAPCEIVTSTLQGQKIHVFQSGITVISFDMTPAQERDLDTIRGERDIPLVLFTRTGTNRDNYRFVVDRLIPSRNVFGVVAGDFPRGLTAQDIYEILNLYIQTERTDPDGRVAEKIRQDQVEAARAQEAARIESARRLNAANREAYLNSVTVGGGYKPVFRPSLVRLSDIEPYDKIVVLGKVSGSQIRDTNISQYLYLTRSDNIVSELMDKWYDLPRGASDYLIFLFLTKSGQNYVLDRYVFYYDLIRNEPREPYPTTRPDIYDAWIIENADN